MILATWLDGILQGINLYVLMGNLIALWGWALFIFTMFVLNAAWWGDEQAQKKRTESAKNSMKYMVLALIIVDVIFGIIKLLNLDDAADSSNSTVSEYFQEWADAIDSGNYNMKLGEDSNSDYKNSNGWDSLNFWE